MATTPLHFGLLRVLLLALVLTSLLALSVAAQTEGDSPEPVLVDEFGTLGDCEFRSRIDSFFAELSNKPDFHGYVITYKGANALPGERDSFIHERTITNHIAFRNFESSRITFMRGGYRTELATEFWMVSPNGASPKPSRTVPEPKTPENRTFLFDKRSFSVYDDLTALDDFVLASVREREAAELAEMERESEAEDSGSESRDVGAEGTARESNYKTESEAREDAESAPFVDQRTEEEKEAERFEWADVRLAEFLATRKAAKGVIIFYADDQRYDIARLKAFVEQGRNYLAAHGRISPTRLRVEFGGYRDDPEAEFWFVPAKGKPPVPAPGARPSELGGGPGN